MNYGTIINIKNAIRITSAEVHDSQVLEKLLNKPEDKGQSLYADSAYTGEKQDEIIKKSEMINKICKKGYRNKPLTEGEKKVKS